MQALILAFLLLLPHPWQVMHQGETWNTHGWACVVMVKTAQHMQWGCTPPAPPPPPSASPAQRGKEPCVSPMMFPPTTTITMWRVPVGCYGGVYWVYHGDCFGWVRYLVPNVATLRSHTTPRQGAVVRFAPGVQGASPSGHYAYLIAIDGRWGLVSEENMWWRGGGYNRVTYRYILLSNGLSYLY